jgi:ArsR family transcriptional regulator
VATLRSRDLHGRVSVGCSGVRRATKSIASHMEISKAVRALESLANPSRLRIFRLLVAAGEEGVPAGAIASELAIPSATLSFHLSQLANSELVDSRRAGRSIIYSLRVDGIRDLLDFLLEDCCQGRPEFCSGIAKGRKKSDCNGKACHQKPVRPARRSRQAKRTG